MDLDDLNIFDKLSAGTFALISGVIIIATITFFVYSVYPLLSTDKLAFTYAIISLVLGVIAPLFYFIEELFNINDLVGKFISGISLSVLVVILINVYMTFDLGKWLKPFPEILLSAILGFITSMFLIRGVIVPAFGGNVDTKGRGWHFDEKEDTSTSEDEDMYQSSDLEEPFEEDEFSEEEGFTDDEGPW